MIAADLAPPAVSSEDVGGDGRGSWLPNGAMVASRLMELRRRRGLVITLAVLTIGLPTLFLVLRLLLHALAPSSYGPAGGFRVFTGLVAGVLYLFAFIAAATLGATSGCSDLADGMFRQVVVTGRSRVAIYLARIPAGLAIIVPMVGVAFAIICGVSTFAAPAGNTFSFQGANVPLGLPRSGFETWAADHRNVILCDFPYGGPCPGNEPEPTVPMSHASALRDAGWAYASYSDTYSSPPVLMMIETGLWIELEAIVAFVFGLGLASLLGQRTTPIVLMIVYAVIFRPFLLGLQVDHFINVQRSLVELAVAHLEPKGVGFVYGVQAGPGGVENTARLLPESTVTAIGVIVAWLVGWSALGAWRMSTRDA